MALGGEPEALLLDEPTTGLDVTTQAHILELLREISNEEDMAMLYVSHDLGAIARVCDRVAVMYSGEIVLTGTSRQVLKKPKHPYAHGLLSSIPKLSLPSLPVAMEGRPPMPGEKINGCAFAERCKLADEKCFSVPPQLLEIDTDEYVRCFNHSTISEIPTQQKIEHRSSKSVKINTLLLEKTSISYAKAIFYQKFLAITSLRSIQLMASTSLLTREKHLVLSEKVVAENLLF